MQLNKVNEEYEKRVKAMQEQMASQPSQAAAQQWSLNPSNNILKTLTELLSHIVA